MFYTLANIVSLLFKLFEIKSPL